MYLTRFILLIYSLDQTSMRATLVELGKNKAALVHSQMLPPIMNRGISELGTNRAITDERDCSTPGLEERGKP